MKQIKRLSLLFCSISLCFFAQGKEYRLNSPNGAVTVNISIDKIITWSVLLNDRTVMEECPISLTLNNDLVLGLGPKVKNTATRRIRQELKPVVPRKKSIIADNYNEMTVYFKDNYAVTFRAYDYGMAYRFETSHKEDLEIISEQMEINFAGDASTYFPEESSFISHNERLYLKSQVKDIDSSRFCSLPVLFRDQGDINVLFTEADLYDYPCMFLFGKSDNSLNAGFPKHVKSTKDNFQEINGEINGDRNEIITEEFDFMAKVEGTRTFPWRLFYISKNISDILENDLVYQLSRPLALDNTDWIKPGKVAWDWWNANNIYGVDFEAGVNTKTYKYYIDFASDYGLEYIMLDEGWSKTTTNVLETHADINIAELVSYGNKKNVDIILWTLWKPLDKDMDAILDRFKDWGVKGIKVDFMQRNDQYMVNYYERVAKEAAKRQLLVDFHGAFKPSGLHRAYPNVLTYEGVKGLENNKWADYITPNHDVILPFTRMVAGPMDYTPGAMENVQPKDYFPRFDRPMSLGTRCHQISMYVIYESPLQMLADSPTNYYKEKETTEFIARIPTTWDDTKVLAAKVGEYIVVARKKGSKWYIGAMNNDSERELDIDFSFLAEGGDHSAEIMQDGANAHQNAIDYKKVSAVLNSNTKLKIKLAPGGGWAAIISE